MINLGDVDKLLESIYGDVVVSIVSISKGALPALKQCTIKTYKIKSKKENELIHTTIVKGTGDTNELKKKAILQMLKEMINGTK
jgi:hypothetical protein